MECSCKQKTAIPQESGQLFFHVEEAILLPHLKEILTNCSLPFVEQDFTLVVSVQNIKQALKSIICHDESFLRMEKSAVSVLFLKEGESLGVSVLGRTRSLQQCCDLFDSDFLVEILDEGRLTSHFQPIIDLSSQSIFGYECLIRGVNLDGSLIPPSRLFDAAHKCNLTFNLDRQARESALKTGAVKKIKEHLFINFLPTTIYNPQTCLQDTFKWASTLEYDYSKLVFEVVETDKIEDFDHLDYVLSYYRAQGVKTALDDVGSGFSSLNVLLKLKPDIIKIDREIIDGVAQDRLKQSIFEALVRISKENGIKVLAEGIEKREDYLFCMANGADYAQGYLFGKPGAEPIRTITGALQIHDV